MSEVKIRWAEATDDAALLEIELTSWDGSSGFPSYLEKMGDTFFGRSGPEAHLVAEDDGVVVGYLRLENKYPFPEGAGVLAINGLAVAKAARGRGVAGALLTAAGAEARSRGARKLSLHVFGSNTAARRLYERHGYVVEAVHTSEFLIDGGTTDDLVLALTL
ncbi:GNAT family N-acetyltransferase [Kribbella sp. NPDC056951]|uniref:GNAT family N-acetyltransferase n=1 Tax=Kribbella sp. NPDC056951 TaxID=3345978 RepID=UPI0036311D13